jgi:hypothetical protein
MASDLLSIGMAFIESDKGLISEPQRAFPKARNSAK